MAWSSTVPAAITAILATFQPAPGLAGVPVRYGPVVSGAGEVEVVLVGWGGDASDMLAADGTVAGEGLAGSPDREQYVIRCAALVLDGGGDLAEATARAYQLAAACGAALAGNRTLGGLALSARITSQSLRLDPVSGARAAVEFGVACDAFTTS